MGGLLSFLSPALTVASQAKAADTEGQQEGNALLRSIGMKQTEEELKRAQAAEAWRKSRALQLGDPGYASAKGDEAGAIEGGKTTPLVDRAQRMIAPDVAKQTALIPGKVQEQTALTPGLVRRAGATAMAEVPAKVAAAKGTADYAAPIATQDTAGGPVTYKTRSQALGTLKAASGGGALAAPMAAKVGQAGEMLKKAHDLLPAMDALDVALPSSAAQDIATNGVGIGHMRIPGTQGAGSLLLNRVPEYATYQAAITPFILAAAHALSGARINDEQVKQIRASIEIKPGESPQSRAQKKKNVIDLINSINGSLPADAIASQEDQMGAPAMTKLQGYGYRGAARKAPAPSTHAATAQQQLWDAAVAKHGQAKVEQEYGPRPDDE